VPDLLARPAFIRDVIARIDWLAEHRSEEQLETFVAGLSVVRASIVRWPKAGAVVREDGRNVLRSRLFPRPLPYVVYYSHRRSGRIRGIELVRLFGAGQERSAINMSDWPW